MKNHTTTLLFSLIALTLTFSNCSKDDPAPPPQRTFEDVENDFRKIDTSPGIRDETLEFQTGNFWNFRIITPDARPGEKYPLIIDLHGASGGAPTAHQHTDCYLEEGFESLEAFMIVPNGEAFQWNHPRNQEKVLALTVLARSNWAVDTNKVAVTGYSNGGNGSWFFGETQAGLFSAAIPMASSYSTLNTAGDIRKMPVPMYVIHGQNDELFPVDSTAKWVNLTRDAGSQVELVIAPDLGHYEPCEYVPYLQDAVTWLKDVVWQ